MRYASAALLVSMMLAIHLPASAEDDWQPRPMAPRWEYHVVSLDDVFETDFVYRGRREENRQLEAHLNRLGDQGWELVNMDQSTLIFKRPQ